MIVTFQAITLFGTGDPKLMAGGISQALVTTVLGLTVAIPIVLLHTLVSGRSKRILHILQEQSAGIVAERSERYGRNTNALMASAIFLLVLGAVLAGADHGPGRRLRSGRSRGAAGVPLPDRRRERLGGRRAPRPRGVRPPDAGRPLPIRCGPGGVPGHAHAGERGSDPGPRAPGAGDEGDHGRIFIDGGIFMTLFTFGR